MLALMDADELLAEAESGRYGDGETMALLALAVAEINRKIHAADDDEGRIHRLVDRLWDVTRKVATQTRARSFSISAGLPLGVSVSLDWEV